jgi:hypothetical protein
LPHAKIAKAAKEKEDSRTAKEVVKGERETPTASFIPVLGVTQVASEKPL